LKKCGEIRIEVQGHTDSQGRESMNLTLSQSRAEAVIEELMNRRILVSNITAKGYGETTPIADNDTEEGREANRRIEFRLIQPDATVSETDTDAQSEEGDSNE
jgi:OOP family OmpA-OmpF porin